jgi:uncharacterized protein
MNQPLIGFGQVRHNRQRPQRNAFAYPTYFLMLPLRSMLRHPQIPGVWALNRSGWLSFFETDHGDGRTPAQGGVLGWLDSLLKHEGIDDATGEVWLQTYPRVLGHTFKPVSFWYCHRAADDNCGALRAIVVEVNNTFGERHCYLLDAPRYGQTLLADKVFHVSPFNPVNGHYAFRFMRSQHDGAEHSVARIDYFDDSDDAQAVLQTSISGTLQPLNPTSLRRALWRYPAMTWGVVLHIHSQALRLWFKRVPWFRKPVPPVSPVTPSVTR